MVNKFKVRLNDIAKIRMGSSSIYEGRVKMISIKGIDVQTTSWTKFVKWRNVLQVIDAQQITRDEITFNCPRGLIDL